MKVSGNTPPDREPAIFSAALELPAGQRAAWPDLLPPETRTPYHLRTIKKGLEVFVYRFFAHLR